MLKPAVLTEYVRAYHEERSRLSQQSNNRREQIEKRLAGIDRESERIIDYMVKGLGDVGRLDIRAKELIAEEGRLKAELAAAQPRIDAIALHPVILARYERRLEDLENALSRGVKSGDHDGAAALRGLIETVTVFRGDKGPGSVKINITGRLNALLGERAFPNRV